MKIFQYATQKFSTEDPDQFNQKLMKLELQNQKAMDALMKDSAEAPIIIEAIGAHLAKDSKYRNLFNQSNTCLVKLLLHISETADCISLLLLKERRKKKKNKRRKRKRTERNKLKN